MALISCPACGKEVSSDAATCPHCGKRLRSSAAKKAGVGCLILLAVLLALWLIGQAAIRKARIAAGLPVDGPAAAWAVAETSNPLDDKPVVTLGREASSGTSRLGQKPELILRCKSGTIDLYIDWKSYLGLDTITVTSRIGTAPKSARQWDISTDKTSTFNSFDAREMAEALADSGRAAFETVPYNENPITAVFDAAGLKPLMPRLTGPCSKPRQGK